MFVILAKAQQYAERTQKLKYLSSVIRLFAISLESINPALCKLYAISLENVALHKTNYSNVSAAINLHTIEFISNFIEHET